MRIALDVDGTLLDFAGSFIKEAAKQGIQLKVGKTWNFFDQDKKAYHLFKNLSDDFWLNLPRIKKVGMIKEPPVAYISHRAIDTSITLESLLNAGFPSAPVYHVAHTEEKVRICKDLNVDIFVDDRASTVCFMEENGINAVLLDQLWNRHINLPRIYKLKELYGK